MGTASLIAPFRFAAIIMCCGDAVGITHNTADEASTMHATSHTWRTHGVISITDRHHLHTCGQVHQRSFLSHAEQLVPNHEDGATEQPNKQSINHRSTTSTNKHRNPSARPGCQCNVRAKQRRVA